MNTKVTSLVAAAQNGAVTLSWKLSGSGQNAIEVKWRQSATASVPAIAWAAAPRTQLASSTTSYTVTGLADGVEYDFQVVPVLYASGSATVSATPEAPVQPTAPVNTAAPVITGTPQVGDTLTASPGAWTGSAPITYTFAWSNGATGATYVPVAADVGKTLGVTVTASNAAGTATATSASVGPVTSAPVNPVPSPEWDGSAGLSEWTAVGEAQGTTPVYVSSPVPNILAPGGKPLAGSFQCAVSNASTWGGYGWLRSYLCAYPIANPSVSNPGPSHGAQGCDSWYRDLIYLPQGFEPEQGSDNNWMYELHNAPDDSGDAMLACGIDTSTSTTPGPYNDGGGGVSSERLSCRIFGGGSAANPFDGYNSSTWYENPDVVWHYPIGLYTVPRNTWIDMVFHVRWDWRPIGSGNGLFEWWISEGAGGPYKQVCSIVQPTLLYVVAGEDGIATNGGNQAYLNLGYYCKSPINPNSNPDTVYHAGMMVGSTAASVGVTV